MTNHYGDCKNAVIEDIITNLKNVDILTLYDIRLKLEKNKPISLEQYIEETWGEYSEGFKKDINHEIRKMWLATTPHCKSHIEICDDSLEDMWSITINGIDPDVWVMEKGTSFNPMDIAQVIFYIYIGKVVWQ